MQNITQAVRRSIAETIDSNNRGMLARSNSGLTIPEWRFTLDRANVRVVATDTAYKVLRYKHWRDAAEDCETLAILPRRYSDKKRNGNYAELMPSIPAIKI